jgi:4-amino-4-deoxy-L-arabinose transferase-like glycosyltransferase
LNPELAPYASRFSRHVYLLLFLAVLALAIPQAALLPLLDRDEPRFAEASREMLQSGNFIVPTFNHVPRYAKPPLTYWCQALCFRALGENAFAARLPSLLATAGTAVVLLAWGEALGSEAIGLAAGLSYAFCLQTLQQGRVATADALLIFFMTLTAFAGWKCLTEEHSSNSRRSYFWDVLLALGFAGGFLAKGPEALLPFVPMLVAARGRGWRLGAELWVNFVLGLALVCFWAIPAYIETNGAYWRQGLSEGIGQRAFVGLQGHGASTFAGYLLTLPIYLVLFWVSALPWSVFVALRGRKLLASWKRDAADTFLLLNAGLIFLVFSLMATKLPHYTLPAFPFLALFVARRWKAAGWSPGFLTELGWTSGIVVALIALLFVPIALALHETPSPVGSLVRQAGDALPPETAFALVDFQEPNAVWEMRRVCHPFARNLSNEQVIPFLSSPGPHAVLLTTTAWKEQQGAFSPAWKVYQATGFNAAKLQRLDLTLVISGSK